MRTLLHVVGLMALAFWIGALVFFGAVLAPTAFTVLPPLFGEHAQGIHAAGEVVGTALYRLHYMGLLCGIAFLVVTFLLLRTQPLKTILVQSILVGFMMVLTAYSQFSLIPRMDVARASVGGQIESVAEENPGRQVFDKLHIESTRVEAIVLLCGLIAFGFAVRSVEPLPVRVRATPLH